MYILLDYTQIIDIMAKINQVACRYSKLLKERIEYDAEIDTA